MEMPSSCGQRAILRIHPIQCSDCLDGGALYLDYLIKRCREDLEIALNSLVEEPQMINARCAQSTYQPLLLLADFVW